MSTEEPQIVEGQRVLGIVPGKPAAGERKELAKDDTVMVWPHLLVRHAVAAHVVLVIVLLVSLAFDAPLREIANPTETPNPEKSRRWSSRMASISASDVTPCSSARIIVAVPWVSSAHT